MPLLVPAVVVLGEDLQAIRGGIELEKGASHVMLVW